MNRTAFHSVMPKTPYYRTDGTGRDIYIAYDNGGAFQPMMSVKNYEKASTRPRSAVMKVSLKSLHYHSNGTGRDSYIKTSDGGLHSSLGPKHFLSSFTNSLRDYKPIKRNYDRFAFTQNNWKSKQDRLFTRTSSKKIKDCISRLYKSSQSQ